MKTKIGILLRTEGLGGRWHWNDLLGSLCFRNNSSLLREKPESGDLFQRLSYPTSHSLCCRNNRSLRREKSESEDLFQRLRYPTSQSVVCQIL